MDFPVLVTYIAPVLAVWAGFFFVWKTKPKRTKTVTLFLAFSGAFLLALTFFELLPEVYKNHPPKIMALYVLAGVLLQVFLEFFSKGAEHGHMRIDIKENRFPILLFLSLSLHALVEGIPIRYNTSMLYGIAIHKIPVAIILSIFLVNTQLKKSAILFFLVIFSLMTPLGSYLTQFEWMQTFTPIFMALAAGVLLHIATIILFENSQGHSFNWRKLIVIILGIGSAYLL